MINFNVLFFHFGLQNGYLIETSDVNTCFCHAYQLRSPSPVRSNITNVDPR